MFSSGINGAVSVIGLGRYRHYLDGIRHKTVSPLGQHKLYYHCLDYWLSIAVPV